jgi:hypothetical protein
MFTFATFKSHGANRGDYFLARTIQKRIEHLRRNEKPYYPSQQLGAIKPYEHGDHDRKNDIERTEFAPSVVVSTPRPRDLRQVFHHGRQTGHQIWDSRSRFYRCLWKPFPSCCVMGKNRRVIMSCPIDAISGFDQREDQSRSYLNGADLCTPSTIMVSGCWERTC